MMAGERKAWNVSDMQINHRAVTLFLRRYRHVSLLHFYYCFQTYVYKNDIWKFKWGPLRRVPPNSNDQLQLEGPIYIYFKLNLKINTSVLTYILNFIKSPRQEDFCVCVWGGALVFGTWAAGHTSKCVNLVLLSAFYGKRFLLE